MTVKGQRERTPQARWEREPKQRMGTMVSALGRQSLRKLETLDTETQERRTQTYLRVSSQGN